MDENNKKEFQSKELKNLKDFTFDDVYRCDKCKSIFAVLNEFGKKPTYCPYCNSIKIL